MKMRKKFRRGFTLVELVVVIAVIAILSAVSVGAYFGITDSANSSNATQGIKQIQKLWTMYSVSDYEDQPTAEDRAIDFCLRYAVDNGPDYEVNYAMVEIDAAPSSVNNKSIHYAYGAAEDNNAILFKVETAYPTWFIVSGQHIVEESTTMIKNNKEFKTSLFESSRLKTRTITQEQVDDDSYEYPFAISHLAGGLRGFGYYRVDIKKENGENATADFVPYYKSVGSTYNLVDFDNELIPGTINVEGVTADKSYVKDSQGGAVDVYEEIKFKLSKEIDATTAAIPGKKYSYVVNEVPQYKFAYNTQQDASLKNYPVALVKTYIAKDSNSNPIEELISTEYTEVPEYTSGFLGSNKKTTWTKTTTNVYKSKVATEQTMYTTLEYAINELKTNTGDTTNFLFMRDMVISTAVEIPSNTIVVIDHILDSKTSIQTYCSNSIGIYKTEVIKQTGSGSGHDVKVEDITNWKTETSEPVVDYCTINTKTIHQGTGRFEKTGGNFDAVKNDKGSIIGHTGDNFKRTADTKINRLTIKKGGSLTFKDDSYLLAEGQVYIPQSYGSMGIGNRSEICVEEGGSINFYNSSFKAFGEVIGGGEINVYNSDVIEFFKPMDYLGGSYTSTMVQNEYKQFPFIQYQLDNIKCKTNLYNGSTLSALTCFSMSGYDFISAPIILYSSNENIAGALFKAENDLETTYITKSYDREAKRMGLDIYGNVTDDEFSMNIEIKEMMNSLIKSKNLDPDNWIISPVLENVAKYYPSIVKSTEFNFPVSNMKINVKENSSLSLSTNGARYELLPSSIIDIEGKLEVSNGAKLTIISGADFSSMINSNTFANVNHLFSMNVLSEMTHKQINLNNNGILTMCEIGENNQLSNPGYIYVSNLSVFADTNNLNTKIFSMNDINESSSLYTYQYRFVKNEKGMHAVNSKLAILYGAAGVKVDEFKDTILDSGYYQLFYINKFITVNS